ncbi:MAG: helix-turn-helix domain-containing protein [Clostridia bacterium]|nr:helix-turn-helix domain-containing protein [Clostridia bacterium]
MDKSFIRHRYAVIRNAHKISARKLSLELGQSSEYINQIENGNSMPSVENLLNFCEYFNISLGEFFEEQFNYPVEYRTIIQELNKLDTIELQTVTDLLKLITANK